MTSNHWIELGPNDHQMSVQDNVQCANIILKAQLTTGLKIPLLKEAVASWQKKHDVLQVSIKRKGLKVYFAPEDNLGPISVRSYFLEDMEEVIATEIDKPFPRNSYPLVRLHYFHDRESFVLVMCISHVIVDGLSASFLINDLLLTYQAMFEGQEAHNPTRTGITVYQEALSQYPKAFKGLAGKIKAYKNYFAYRKNSQAEKPVPSFSPVWKNQRRCRLLNIQLDQEQLAAVKQTAKSYGVSTNSLLMACWLTAVRSVYDDKHSLPLSLYTPVDLRHRLKGKLSDDALGLCTGLLRLTQILDESCDIKQLSKMIHQKMNDRIEAGEAHVTWQSLPPSSLPELGALGEKMYLNTIRNATLTSCSAWTNMGNIDRYLDDKKSALSPIISSCDISTLGGTPIPFVVALMQYNSCLSINVVYARAMLDQEVAKKVLDQFEKNIKQHQFVNTDLAVSN